MIHLNEKTRQLPDTGMTFPFPTTNILMYLSGQNETLPWDLSMPTTPLTYDYDPTCCTFSNTTGATTNYTYDPGNSSINTGKSSSFYDYDNICGLHPCESRSTDNATYVDFNLHYYGYRYYSPEMGRFLSRDPAVEGIGIVLYEFVGNAPVLGYDLFGLAACVSGHQRISLPFGIQSVAKKVEMPLYPPVVYAYASWGSADFSLSGEWCDYCCNSGEIKKWGKGEMTVSFSSLKAGITVGKSVKGSWKSFNYEGLLGVDASANLDIEVSAAAEGSSCPGDEITAYGYVSSRLTIEGKIGAMLDVWKDNPLDKTSIGMIGYVKGSGVGALEFECDSQECSLDVGFALGYEVGFRADLPKLPTYEKILYEGSTGEKWKRDIWTFGNPLTQYLEE